MSSENSPWTNQTTWMLVAGCMFIGIAVGRYVGAMQVGVMGGMGAGLLIAAIYHLVKK